MSGQTKGRAGEHQATSNTSINNTYFTRITFRMKALIITLALWGLLPVGLADWIIHLGDIRDE